MRTIGKLLSALLGLAAFLALATSALAAGHGQVGFGFNATPCSKRTSTEPATPTTSPSRRR
jgi:hypothetical protein